MKKYPDAAVIGAGIAGSATAYYFAKAGLSVELIETTEPAWGASGRNPGFLWLQSKQAGLPLAFSLAGRQFAEELAGQLPSYGFRACGGLIIYRDESLSAVAQKFADDRCSAGLPVQHMSISEVLELCPCIGPAVSGALWNPLDAHQDTRRLVALLAAGAEACGCRIRQGERATRLSYSGGRCTGLVLESGQEISAGLTVVAAGPWSNTLLAPLGLAIPMVPMRFEAAETAAAPFHIEPVICGQALFKFFNTSGKEPSELPSHPAEAIRKDLRFTEQIAQFPDGSLQFGCAFEAGTTDDRPTTAGQGMAATVMSDNIAGFGTLPLIRSWAGIVGQTADGLPVVDARPGPEGLAINAGHFFGNLVGAFSGKMLADICTGREPLFSPNAFRLSRFKGNTQ